MTVTLHSVPLLSTTTIPLWRWQRMLLFMLGNLTCCIVTATLLNLVDHRQVLHLAHQWFHGINAIKLILISFFTSFFITGWCYKQDNQKIQGDRTRKEVTQPGQRRHGKWEKDILFQQPLDFVSCPSFLLLVPLHFKVGILLNL